MPLGGSKEASDINKKLEILERELGLLAKKLNTHPMCNEETLGRVMDRVLKSNERDNKLNMIISLLWSILIIAIGGLASLWLLAE